MVILAGAVLLLGCNLTTLAPATPAVPTVTSFPATATTGPALDMAGIMETRPLVWFAPLPPMPTGPGREYIGSEDFMSLFQPDAPWPTAASHVQVFKLYGEWVAYHATDDQLRQAVSDIQRRGMALAVEAGPLDAPPDCGQGVESFAGKQEGLKIARRIKAAGGTLNLIALDEPYFFAHAYDGPSACHWPAEKIAAEVGGYIAAIREAVPGVIIGDTEPLAGTTNPQAYRSWLDTFEKVNGYKPAFLHMDVDWGRPSWAQEVKEIIDYGAQVGVPVGIIYFGNHVDKTDEAWISAAGERVKKLELEVGAKPAHILFQSWQDKPDFVLPESKAFTWTNFIDAYFTDKAGLGFKREGAGGNLALGKASRQVPDQTAGMAIDGDVGSMWGAGDFAPQWIEIDLGAPHSIQAIRLTVSQYPEGDTSHRILVRGPSGDFRLVHAFIQSTHDGDVLEYAAAEPLTGVQVVRIETTASPSWVAWREIEIIAAE